MNYELYPPEGSPEDLIIDEYLELANGTLVYCSNGKFYLDVPGASHIYDTLEAMMADITYNMKRLKGETK